MVNYKGQEGRGLFNDSLSTECYITLNGKMIIRISWKECEKERRPILDITSTLGWSEENQKTSV
jgi:hypothetical protein